MKPKPGKYSGGFAFTNAAKDGEFLEKEFMPFMVNRILSGSAEHIGVANSFNDINLKTVGKSVIANLMFRYFNEHRPYGPYFKTGKQDGQIDDKLIMKLSDLLSCPYNDAEIYIRYGLYNEDDIKKEWSSIYEYY